MTVKSIIDVDVNDASFGAFLAKFKSYEEQVKKMPAHWRQQQKPLGDARKTFEVMVGDAVKLTHEARLLAAAEEVVARMTRTTSQYWGIIAQRTRDVAGNIHGATASLLRWASLTSVFSGLLGLGGLWGLERMAEGVASRRRAAAGIGVGFGQHAAFGLNFDRFVDAQAMMANVGGGLSDATSPAYAAMLAAGVHPRDKSNAADTSIAILKQIPRLFQGVPTHLIGPKAQALGLPNLGIDAEVIKRYMTALPGEREQQENKYREDAKALDLQKEAARQWQDFTTQMMRAASKIEMVFVRGLTPLVPSLTKVSESFIYLVESLGRSEDLKKWIGDVAGGLREFADYVKTDEFKIGVKDFAEGVVAIAKAIGRLLMWIGGKSPELTVEERKEKSKQSWSQGMSGLWHGAGQLLDDVMKYGILPPPGISPMLNLSSPFRYNQGPFAGRLENPRTAELGGIGDEHMMAGRSKLPSWTEAASWTAPRRDAAAWDRPQVGMRTINRSGQQVTITVDSMPGGNVPDIVNQAAH